MPIIPENISESVLEVLRCSLLDFYTVQLIFSYNTLRFHTNMDVAFPTQAHPQAEMLSGLAETEIIFSARVRNI